MVSKIATYALAGIMVFAGVGWASSFFNTGMLAVFALVLIFIASRTRFHSDVLMFFGLASILYIIQDFNVGPSSDLAQYAKIFVVIPPSVWMYIWLGVALLLFFWNIRLIFREQRGSNIFYEEYEDGVV